jgi:farnesol dehydrogenase
MRVLVTGGTGYLGAAIVRAAVRHGHTPIVFARRASTSALPGVLIDGDVRDPGALAGAARGVDAIVHAAALVSVWRLRREEFEEVNVGGLQNAMDVCRSTGIPRLIYTSSFLALPPAGCTAALEANDYQRTKASARKLAREASARGAPIVTLFPGVIYGPGTATEGNLIGRLIRDHLQGRLPGLIGADLPWSYAYVDDVAEGHVAAITRGRTGAEYVLGGVNAPQMQVFEIVQRLAGVALPRRIPFALAELGAVLEEALARLASRPPRLTRGVVKIFRHDWSLDSRSSIDELGYRITPLEQGVRATLAALR